MFKFLLRFTFSFRNALAVSVLVTFLICSAAAQTQPQTNTAAAQSPTTPATPKSDSPTATVQEFYKAMRERRFRDALMMTNLSAAVEKLSTAEMTDLTPDFEPMAARVPEKIDINGEQISGNLASVFVKAQDSLTGELKVDEIKMRRENNAWVILTGDQETEAQARREGAGYFFKLRIDSRHADVEDLMKEIIKAELVYNLQHKGEYADLQTLTNEKLLGSEVLNPDVIGYRFSSQISADKKKYTVNAEPAQYGKTGKLSFLLTSGDAKGGPRVQKDDKNGQPLGSKN